MSTPDAPASESAEVTELVDFLYATPPFTDLAREDVARLARRLDITYVPAGTDVLQIGDAPTVLYLIRTGAVELTNDAGALVARLGEREFFGYPALLTDAPAQRRVTTLEDSLLYLIPEAAFDRLRSLSDPVDRFFARAHSDRIRDALREEQQETPLATPLHTLLVRAPVTASPDVSIREAAQRMRQERVSCLLLCRDGTLVGLITDRDLRTRVVAAGVDPDRPVRAIMTPDPVTVNADRYAFEALLTMSRRNVHHLPVMDASTLAGVVTTTDLMRLQADNPVYIVGEVWKQDDLEGLVDVSRRVPQVVVDLVRSGARAHDVTRVVTAVSDALTQRLLDMAEDRFGPPPVPYAWLALGSQARFEQTAHSDQDNALLLSNDADPETHDAYFRRLAGFVCDGLNACGYPYCPGEVMATTDRWRQSLEAWKNTFRTWIESPTPKALMHATIFFDLRHIHGTAALSRELRSFILEQTPHNTIFLACLTTNALEAKPPLGFFRRFVLNEHGGQEDTLDLKHTGVVPIVDIARIYALAHGVGAVNTRARLQALAETGGLNASDSADLRDAHAFIDGVRLDHQADQIRRAEPPDNYIAPDRLSDFDRRHLKDAFNVVKTMQSALAQRYQTGFLS
jgi:CBS domain-containing protein